MAPARQAAAVFQDRELYAQLLDGGWPTFSVHGEPHHTTVASLVLAVLVVLAAFGVAAYGLRGPSLPGVVLAPLDRLRTLHSGAVGDYVAWLVLGTALLGGFVTLAAL